MTLNSQCLRETTRYVEENAKYWPLKAWNGSADVHGFFNQQKQCKTEKRCIGKPCALFLNTPNNWHMASTDVVYLLSVADISHINIRYSPLSISILQMNLLLPFQQHIINYFCSTKLMLLFFFNWWSFM